MAEDTSIPEISDLTYCARCDAPCILGQDTERVDGEIVCRECGQNHE